VRPHQALGYLTPNAFYAQWLTDRAGPNKVGLSDITWPSTGGWPPPRNHRKLLLRRLSRRWPPC